MLDNFSSTTTKLVQHTQRHAGAAQELALTLLLNLSWLLEPETQLETSSPLTPSRKFWKTSRLSPKNGLLKSSMLPVAFTHEKHARTGMPAQPGHSSSMICLIARTRHLLLLCYYRIQTSSIGVPPTMLQQPKRI